MSLQRWEECKFLPILRQSRLTREAKPSKHLSILVGLAVLAPFDFDAPVKLEGRILELLSDQTNGLCS